LPSVQFFLIDLSITWTDA